MSDRNDLYKMHKDLSDYFQTTLDMGTKCLKHLSDLMDNEEIEYSEYIKAVKEVTLPPATLTAISSFLKTNDIMVLADTSEKALGEYEDTLSAYTSKTKAIMANLDVTAELN